MLEASDEFRSLMAGGKILLKADLNLADGTLVPLEGGDLMAGGATFTTASSSASSFDVGAAIIGRFDFTLRNDDRRFDDYDFEGAKVVPKVGAMLSTGDVEWLQKGIYWVEPPDAYSEIITISALDNMSLFEKSYGEVPTSYPATLRQIVADICSTCGVPIATPTFKNDTYRVQTRLADSETPCIEVLGYAAQVAGCFADVDTDGRLRMRWYDSGAYEEAGRHAEISALKSLTVGVNEVGVSGLYVTAQGSAAETEGESYLYGLDGYVLKIANNKLIEKGRAREVAEMLGPEIAGMWFRPLNIRAISDPTIEAGDPIIVTDRRGRAYRSWATQVAWSTTGVGSIACGAERTSKLEKAKRRTAQEQAARDLATAISSVSPDHFYMYHGENSDALTISAEVMVARITFATVADTRVAINTTVNHTMNLDGDVIARIYVNGTLMKTVEAYEARGCAILDFMWSSEFVKDSTFDVTVTLEPKGVISQIRENDADNLTLWNRSRANSSVYWQELRDAETWGTVRAYKWETWASGSAKEGTWAAIMRTGEPDWRVVRPTDVKPTINVEARDAQVVLFGRGLAEIESWDGIVSIYDTMGLLSLTQEGLGLDYADRLEASAHTPAQASISETFGLSLTRHGLTIGYSEEIGFGEDSETVWADDLTYDPIVVTATKGTWYASSAATVDTCDFGEDRTVRSVASVAVAVSGAIAFRLSYDRGTTWGDAMSADELNAKESWPAPPFRVRMEMEAGSRVNGMTINYNR